ncbi:hypothetical protein HRI_001445300 [Hibiscus trionum]|uniref:C2H2-type domain-containing protein n=1 Tax=Hibiscus trionum TaxID=183268 RepID=A0A9W7HHF3_HIBTR|nr:hypothetical protein HRI_001445300 [Hibiscus trionum]
MSFHSDKEVAEKHEHSKTCFYCNKEFDNYRALGGHLLIHQENQSLRSVNFSGRSSNSIDINRNPHVPLPNIQQNSAGANNLVPTAQAPPPVDYYTMFYSNEANQASSSRSTVSSPGVPQTQILMSPYGVAFLYNSLAPREYVPAGTSVAMSSAVHVPSGSVVATGLPTDSLPYLVPNGVQINQDDLPPTSPDALNSTQDYDLGPEDLPLLDNFIELTSAAETGDGVEEEGSADLDLSLHF